MAKEVDKCVLNVLGKTSRLSKIEVEQLASDIKEIIQEAEISGKNVDEILDASFNNYSVQIQQKIKEKALTMEKVQEYIKLLDDNFLDDPNQGILSMMTTEITKKKYISSGNMESKKGQVKNNALSIWIQEVEKNPQFRKLVLKTKEADEQILRYIQSKGMDTSGMAEGIIAVAKGMKKSANYMYQRLVDAGYSPRFLDDFLVTQMHPVDKLRSYGKENWQHLANELFDWDRMEIIRPEEKEEFLTKMWHKIMGPDKGNIEIKDDLSELIVSKVARKFERAREVHFRPGMYAKYAQELNLPNLSTQFLNYIDRTSGHIAAAQMFGPSYRLGFEKVMQRAADIAEPLKKRKKGLLSSEYRLKQNYHKRLFDLNLRGSLHENTNMVAVFGARARQLANMSKLGTAVLTTATDFSYGAGTLSALTGESFAGHLTQLTKDTLRLSTAPLRKYFPKTSDADIQKKFAAEMGVFLEDIILTNLNRFGGDEFAVTTGFDRFHNTMMEATGLPSQARGAKLAIAKQASRYFDRVRNKRFSQLYKGTQEIFNVMGIDEQGWNIIRKAVDPLDSTQNLITPNAILEIPDYVLIEAGVEKAQVGAKRRDLSEAYGAVITEIGQTGSPTPGVRVHELKERVDPNTIMGQLIRFGLQFKSFTLAVANTMRTVRRLGNAEDFGNYKLAAETMVTATILGGMVLMSKDISKARLRKKEDYMTKEFLIDSMLQGGSFLIYGDFLMTDYTNRYRNFASDIAGPVSSGLITDIGDVWSTILHPRENKRTSQEQRIKRTTLNLFERNLPSVAPIAGPFLKATFFDYLHKTLDTGKKRRDRMQILKNSVLLK
jgi:hypothetical protein